MVGMMQSRGTGTNATRYQQRLLEEGVITQQQAYEARSFYDNLKKNNQETFINLPGYHVRRHGISADKLVGVAEDMEEKGLVSYGFAKIVEEYCLFQPLF